ncbi:unnamed protein product, partial [Timema podura]|nr:unnamed protein product [Timema podura]
DAWFIVPKPKNSPDFEDKFWRLAFHEQERELIHGKGNLKPICRLLKKMRDSQGWFPLESYYIKTFLMWEVMEQEPEFWTQRLSFLFLQMIDKLQEKIKEGCIKYFWDTRYNLLEGMTQTQLGNYVGRINKIKKILNKKIFEADVCDPFAIAELIDLGESTKINKSLEERRECGSSTFTCPSCLEHMITGWGTGHDSNPPPCIPSLAKKQKEKANELEQEVSVDEIVNIAKGISRCSECDVDDVEKWLLCDAND